MPVIDKPSFLRKYKDVMDHRENPEFKRNYMAFIALMCSVFAVASRFVDDPRLNKNGNLDDGGMGVVYIERCVRGAFAVFGQAC